MDWVTRNLEHVEAFVLIFAPIVGVFAVFSDPSATNVLLFSILMVAWKIGNGAL